LLLPDLGREADDREIGSYLMAVAFTARFRQPARCRPRTRHVWGTRQKPLGVGDRRAALLFERLSVQTLCDAIIPPANRRASSLLGNFAAERR
jgi:hypothetical protein